MTYLIEGLDPAPYLPLAGLSDAALAALGARRMRVTESPGFPCRLSLDEAEEGATVLLVNHVSRPERTPFRAAHAIFVTEGATGAASYRGVVPPSLGRRVLSLRAFDADGMMVDAMLVQPGAADGGLRRLLANPTVTEVDAHNAVRGCFAARARRA